MILPYLARLRACAWRLFSWCMLVLGLAVSLSTPLAVRLASRMAPVHGARLLLALRLFPAAFALFVVAGLCTPSYLYLEPKEAPEEMGLACLVAAADGPRHMGLVNRPRHASHRAIGATHPPMPQPEPRNAAAR